MVTDSAVGYSAVLEILRNVDIFIAATSLSNIQIMNKLYLLAFAIISLLCSCGKMNDPDLGEFHEMESFIDMSQKNQFDSKLLCNKWIRSKVTYEVYMDGVRESSTDVTHEWGKGTMDLILRDDNTMTIGSENGRWLYTHNYLLWTPGMWALEVLKVDKNSLNLRIEFPYEDMFFVNNSGRHDFYIFEYQAN